MIEPSSVAEISDIRSNSHTNRRRQQQQQRQQQQATVTPMMSLTVPASHSALRAHRESL